MKTSIRKALVLLGVAAPMLTLRAQINPPMHPEFPYQTKVIFSASEATSASIGGMDLTAVQDYDNTSAGSSTVLVDIVDRTGGGATLIQTLVITSPIGNYCGTGDLNMTHNGENLYVVYECYSGLGVPDQLWMNKYYFDPMMLNYVLVDQIYLADGSDARMDMGPEGYGSVLFSDGFSLVELPFRSNVANAALPGVDFSFGPIPGGLSPVYSLIDNPLCNYDIAIHEPYSAPAARDVKFTVSIMGTSTLHIASYRWGFPGIPPDHAHDLTPFSVEGCAEVKICSPKENGMVAHTSPYSEYSVVANRSGVAPYLEDLGVITGDAMSGVINPYQGVNMVFGPPCPTWIATDHKRNFYCTYAIDWNQASTVSFTWAGRDGGCSSQTFSTEFDPAAQMYPIQPGQAHEVSYVTGVPEPDKAILTSSQNGTDVIAVFGSNTSVNVAPPGISPVWVVISSDYMVKTKDLTGLTVYPTTYKTTPSASAGYLLTYEEGNRLRLQFPPSELTGTVTLYDVRGGKVLGEELAAGLTECRLALPHLSAGVYLLKYESGSKQEVFKVIR